MIPLFMVLLKKKLYYVSMYVIVPDSTYFEQKSIYPGRYMIDIVI